MPSLHPFRHRGSLAGAVGTGIRFAPSALLVPSIDRGVPRKIAGATEEVAALAGLRRESVSQAGVRRRRGFGYSRAADAFRSNNRGRSGLIMCDPVSFVSWSPAIFPARDVMIFFSLSLDLSDPMMTQNETREEVNPWNAGRDVTGPFCESISRLFPASQGKRRTRTARRRQGVLVDGADGRRHAARRIDAHDCDPVFSYPAGFTG